MSEKIRIGVVGTSFWSDRFLLARFKEHPGADLVAVCGRNRSRAEEVAAKYAIPEIYGDYQEMIARANLQALAVATPDDLHYPITMAALDAGLHVLCEKPLARNGAQAKAMFEKAQAMGVIHRVSFTYRWNPIHRYVRQLLDEGYLGQCYQIQLRFMGSMARNYSWRFDKNHSNGSLGEMGSHMLDLARWYGGEITQVFATLSTLMHHTSPEGVPLENANDVANLALRFANGVPGTVQLSAVAQVGKLGNRQYMLFSGEAGTLEVNYSTFGGGELRGCRAGEPDFHTLAIPPGLWGTNDLHAPFDVYKINTAARPFIDAILAGASADPSFYDGYQVQRVIDAAIASDREGRWESLNHD